MSVCVSESEKLTYPCHIVPPGVYLYYNSFTGTVRHLQFHINCKLLTVLLIITMGDISIHYLSFYISNKFQISRSLILSIFSKVCFRHAFTEQNDYWIRIQYKQ